MTNSASIIIIDDNKETRNLLSDMIQTLGHIPILAENGLSALTQIKKRQPDLVLLDILMPEMDGYEVLSRIKGDSNLSHIPVIIITAVDDMESAVKCIKKGADDYLTKPFIPALLKARIENSLKKKRLQDQEKEYSAHLGDEIRRKTKELSEAYDRLKIVDKTKSDFLNLISHELRTPLSGVLGTAEILIGDDLDNAARNEFKEMFEISKKKILAILDGALLLTQIEVTGKSFPLKPTSIQRVLKFSADILDGFARSREVEIGIVPNCNAQVLCNQELLVKAMASLLETAIQFSTKNGKVSFSCEFVENEISIGIRAAGRTISEEAIPRFFEVFSITESMGPGCDLGLGPPVAQRIIKLFNGSITVENQTSGIYFTVRLKRIKNNE